MSDDPKIVKLNTPVESAEASSRLPVAAEAIKTKCQSYLTEQFKLLLDDLDDHLFELADVAGNAQEQQVFFDAMHELRLQRQTMEARFDDRLAGAYGHFLTGATASAIERGEARLRVLESDVLEETVALEGISKRTERRFAQEVWMLCTAWQHCLGGNVPTARDLPMGPYTLTGAVARSFEGLKFDIKAKLVLLKFFERRVMGKYDELCQQLVPVLQAHGLPADFSAAPRREQSKPQAKAAEAEAQPRSREALNNDATELANKLFDTLEKLLGSSEDGAAPETTLSKPSLMVALQDLQNEQYAQFNVKVSIGREGSRRDAGLLQKLVHRLEEVSRVSAADAAALSEQRDLDTIEHVSSLFHYILEGEGLSGELKSVIGRLQIPILKMAMLDKNFFSEDEHPARKLLSSLLNAGLGWTPPQEPQKDPLYRKVEEIVMRVLRDFGVDSQIFVDAHEDFMSFSERDRRRAELIAKRLADAAGGRAVADEAKTFINSYLDGKITAGRYPPIVGEILRAGWSKVLFLSYVKDGRDSRRMAEDLKVVERLLWSVDADSAVEHRNQLIDALPGLVATMRDGFNRASLSAFETTKWFEQLERIHLAKLARPRYSAAASQSVRQPEQPEPAPDAPTDTASLDDSATGVADTLGSYDPDDIFQPSEQPEAAPDAQALEEASHKIAALRVGNWVDLRQPDGKMLRCRLAAVINGIGKYIFVNRAGIKVAEYDRDTLIKAMHEERLFLIEDGRLFDRALESVISNLREMKDKPQE